MGKPITVIFLPQAEDFVEALEIKARRKLFFAIRKTKERIIGQWFTKLKSSEGIYEFRFDECDKFYRLFAFWDTEGESETMVIGTHGIAKKTNQTPKDEIKKAERIKREYFEEKNRTSKNK
ncbi:MAG: type II toxin-antitoxin system RelE/ParE family toxin [Prolixibacteraceae bacterium]|jgi:phage-related protein|nr:type II toxin-antitoxin system RelE/ParE family toxin [Prolixibacteraceae bacterium]